MSSGTRLEVINGMEWGIWFVGKENYDLQLNRRLLENDGRIFLGKRKMGSSATNKIYVGGCDFF